MWSGLDIPSRSVLTETTFEGYRDTGLLHQGHPASLGVVVHTEPVEEERRLRRLSREGAPSARGAVEPDGFASPVGATTEKPPPGRLLCCGVPDVWELEPPR